MTKDAKVTIAVILGVVLFAVSLVFLIQAVSNKPTGESESPRHGEVVYSDANNRVVRIVTDNRYCYLAEKRGDSFDDWHAVALECI